MPMSDYLQQLRQKVGHDLLLLPSAAVVLVDKQNRILFGKHSDRNIWVLPGGLIEPAELPADAALRELWEETGLIAELTGILGVYGGPDLIVEYVNGDRASYVATIFRGHITGGSLRPDGTEILEARYFSREELEETPHAKWMNSVLDTLFDRNGVTHFQPPTWRPE
jgi:8-oxo-dGTP pyrophosphatase MutT (NUDIX family)